MKRAVRPSLLPPLSIQKPNTANSRAHYNCAAGQACWPQVPKSPLAKITNSYARGSPPHSILSTKQGPTTQSTPHACNKRDQCIPLPHKRSHLLSRHHTASTNHCYPHQPSCSPAPLMCIFPSSPAPPFCTSYPYSATYPFHKAYRFFQIWPCAPTPPLA